jgi:hypothetical protein
MIVVLARESAARRQTTPRKLAVRLAREIFNASKPAAKNERLRLLAGAFITATTRSIT